MMVEPPWWFRARAPKRSTSFSIGEKTLGCGARRTCGNGRRPLGVQRRTEIHVMAISMVISGDFIGSILHLMVYNPLSP